ncbi:MAG: SMC-Scp complex subunit ScpB [Erysipelotrichaceae bacterium]
MNKVQQNIEGLLFMVGDEGLTFESMKIALNISDEDLNKELEDLANEYEDSLRAFKMVSFGSYYKLVTKEDVYDVAKELFKDDKKQPLSNSALETLAIIAYKQPITRVEIEEIRGVGCEVMLKKLQAKDLIYEYDRLDTIGKPILYKVTDTFMDTFNLKDLQELPNLGNDSDEITESELF